MEYNVGDIITCDMPFVHVLNENKKNKFCDYCCFENDHLKKCTECKHMHYCDRVCQKNDWRKHKFECKLYKLYYDQLKANLDRFLLRLYLLIKSNPQSIYEKHALYHDPNSTRCFAELMTHRQEIINDPVRYVNFKNLCLRLKHCQIDFNHEDLFECFCKICINSFTIVNVELNEIGSGLYISESQFDHSCRPNAAAIFNGSYCEIRAIKHISTVESINLNYIDIKNPKQVRQKSLFEQYYFECTCQRCQSDFDQEIDYDELRNDIENMDKLINETKDWQKAYELGLKTLPVYEKIYDNLHPDLTLQLVRVLKLRIYIYSDLEHETLLLIDRVKKSIEKTHGCNHELYKLFQSIINQ